MDSSLNRLCAALKKVLSQLKPQANPLSFLILTGRAQQGKSALLRQSGMEEMPVFAEQNSSIYFNHRGVIVELSETWLTQSKGLTQNILKQLNRSHPAIKITGLILCIEVNALLASDPLEFAEQKKGQIHLLKRLGNNLGYPCELAIIMSKMDVLAGFSDFYQMDHPSELSKPLGFSLESPNHIVRKIEVYQQQFRQFIEHLSQQVLNKMHPARSTLKRSLIREFPLQLASLRAPIQSLIKEIPFKWFRLQGLYFTSAEQGGLSIDRLNKKIQHEYALVVQDRFPQANNFKPYFVDGAFKSIQEHSSQLLSPYVREKRWLALTIGLAGLSLLCLVIKYHKTANLLDEASKALLSYDSLNQQNSHSAKALYQLSKAANRLDSIHTQTISLPTVEMLKSNLAHQAQHQIEEEFLPSMLNELEHELSRTDSLPLARYKALKIYLMLADSAHRSSSEIAAWFKTHWNKGTDAEKTQEALLNATLQKPLKSSLIKQQLITDARNYLNALPGSYLYYSLAKESFPKEMHKLEVKGFTLASNELPVYLTKSAFHSILNQLPKISQQLKAENWILNRQDLTELNERLTEAYCFEYVTWWQNFMHNTKPMHYQSYDEGRRLVATLKKSNAINQLLNLIQSETKPDLSKADSLFNQKIAKQFTDFNLMSESNTRELILKMSDLERFVATLAVVNDAGKTAFRLTRARFSDEKAADPVSLLYNQARQAPEPLNAWGRQLASDTWMLLLRDTRQYINQEWQQTVYQEFQKTIAKRYPFDSSQQEEISLAHFNHFFATHGALNRFNEEFIKPFLDVSEAQWKPKAVNDAILPLSPETIDCLIRANIITNMFFPNHSEETKIDFSLQKISLDPVIASLQLDIGDLTLTDSQSSDSSMRFTWPKNDAKLTLHAIDGNHYELTEQGVWALFKLLEKVNVLVDEQDSTSLQVLFEVNSNSGRYLLKANNQVNPFTPGILNGFKLNEALV